ncbi:alpha/beta hydrolase [Streptomyces sp. NPDC019396]|uniref:alpha/beta fold hydrolase n=1 Tax=Streptomyces sp. NPDC019396 TaxID=3154687 RepID=UPI0033F38990
MTSLYLADGRTLEYLVAGPTDGTPLVLHNGTPSAAMVYGQTVATAARHGLRVVVHSRPGYAGSSPKPGRTVAAVASDVAAILDELDADRFLTVGWSGGGPHALACAALMPGRCLAAATVAGVAPYGAEGLDWMGGMGAENIKEFGAAAAGQEPLAAVLNTQASSLAEVQAHQIVAAMSDLVSDVDRKVLTDEFADYMAAMFREAVSSGIAGWRDDDLAFVAHWGFGLDTIETPVSVWQGAEDQMVPYAHGRWLASRLTGSTVHLESNEGHFSLVLNAFDDIVTELTRHLV